jgi:hypothetical protein
MATSLRVIEGSGKATRPTICRDPYRLARRRALRGYETQIAARLHVRYNTLQHELTDAERDPVGRVVARLEALRALGGDRAAAAAYVAEILDTLESWDSQPEASVATLADRAQMADLDEDIVEPRMRAAAVGGDVHAAAAWLDALLQQHARARPLIAALRAIVAKGTA